MRKKLWLFLMIILLVCMNSVIVFAATDYDHNMTVNTDISGVQLDTPVLKSVSNVADGVKVSWNPVKNAERYKVFYKTSDSSWKGAGTTSNTSFTVKGLSSGKKYYFTVRCIHTDNVTYRSMYDTTGKAIYYLKKASVSLSNTKTGIKIKWNQVAGATGYQLYRKVGTDAFVKIKNFSSNDTISYIDTSASTKNGVRYTYYVRAYRGSTIGSYEKKNIYRLTAVSLSLSNVTEGTIKATWGRNTKASGYQVQVSRSNTFYYVDKSYYVAPNTSLAKIINGLPPGEPSNVRVRAYKETSTLMCYSAWSSIKTITTYDGTNFLYEDRYIIPDSNKKYLTYSDIGFLSKKLRMYARNEIFARRGYIFKDEELMSYFLSKSWYTPRFSSADYVTGLMNNYELKNIDFISSYE